MAMLTIRIFMSAGNNVRLLVYVGPAVLHSSNLLLARAVLCVCHGLR